MTSRQINTRTVLRLVGLAYEASLDASRWGVFLSQFADAMGGALTSIHLQDVTRAEGRIASAIRFDPEWVAAYEDHYAAVNPFMSGPSVALLQPGRTVLGEEVCSDQRLASSDYYNGFLRPQDLWHLCGAILDRSAGLTSNLTTMRSRRHGTFSPVEVRLLQTLVPHLQQALQIHRRLAIANRDREATLEACRRLSTAVLCVSSSMRVLFANTAAERLLSITKNLVVRQGTVFCADSISQRDLCRLVLEASQTSAGEGLGTGGLLKLDRGPVQRPLLLSVVPVPTSPDFAIGADTRRALILIADSDTYTVRPDALRALFGLTRAESAMAQLLLEGLSVPAAAERLGITQNTAKTHAKRIYLKSGASGQASFLALSWRILGGLRA
jgi:DNA-binding CsgD family transcriptional regulator